MPSCLGRSGLVRTRRIPHDACCASEFHTFWPLTTNSSPSRSARQPTLERSLPASGSLNSWHHNSSPRSNGPTKRACCSGVAWVINVGPTRDNVAVMKPDVAS